MEVKLCVTHRSVLCNSEPLDALIAGLNGASLAFIDFPQILNDILIGLCLLIGNIGNHQNIPGYVPTIS